jgi:hypothetical protein
MLGLIAVVTGSRELYKSAEPSTVKRLLLLRGLLGARLGFRRLLGFFRGHIQRLLSLGFSDARSKGKGLAPPTSDEQGDRSRALVGYQHEINIAAN